MTHLSLFSGIGGLDLAAEWAGFTTIGFVERDPFCQKVLAKHWPGVPIHDDVSSFDPGAYVGCDLVSGGFPCQDVSSAASHATVGIEGPRSSLFRHLLRIVRIVRPRFALLENVSGLIVGGGISTVLGELAEMGLDAMWGSPQATSVGAFHQRERVFILAYAAGFRYQDLESEIRHLYENGGEHNPPKSGWHLSELQASPRFPAHLRPIPEGGILRMADGVPSRLDRYRALGNAVVPAQAYPILQAIADQIRRAA